MKGDALLIGAPLAPQDSPAVFLTVPRKTIFIMRIAGYYDSPRLILALTSGENETLNVKFDLQKNTLRTTPFPRQVVGADFDFEIVRGLMESTLEGQVLSSVRPTGNFYRRYFSTGNEPRRVPLLACQQCSYTYGQACQQG